MEVKPGYKQTEVGVIPEEWEDALLDHFARRGSGHTPDKKHPEYWNGSIKWISLADSPALDRVFIDETFTQVTPDGIANSSAVLYPAGTVVLSRDAGVGKSAIMRTEMAVSQHFMAWRCGSALDNHFLYYWLQSAKPEFERIANGSTIKTIGLPYFQALKFPHPPLPEQRAIAEALSDVDGLLGGLDRLIAKKRDLKQAAMQQLLTGQTRLPAFHGEWEETTFGSVVRHHAGNSSLIKGKLPSSEATGRFPAYSASGQDVWCDHFEYEGDAIVVSAVGSRCGKAFKASGRWCAIANTHVVWPNSAKIDTRFLAYFIDDEDFWQKSGTGQPFVLFAKTFALPLRLPKLPEQTAIAAVLSEMDGELAVLEQRREKTRALKQAMMQELLTGRTRLV